MHSLDVVLALYGGLMLLLGLFATVLRRHLAAEPVVALVCGALLGPYALNVVDPVTFGPRDRILTEIARLTLAVSLVETALRLPAGSVRGMLRPLAVLLGVILPLMVATSGLLAWGLLPVPLLTAMAIGACLGPTDPVVAGSIVNGQGAREMVPERLRHRLSAESGLNDGLAYPLLALPLTFLAADRDRSLVHWLLRSVLWEVLGAVAAGAALGWGAGRLLRWARRSERMEAPLLLGYTIALGLVALGAASLMHSDAILAVMIAGLVFDRIVEQDESEERAVQRAAARFFTIPVFLVLGAYLPLGAWWDLGWAGVALALAVLMLRRLPWMLASGPLFGDMALKDRLFLGWFGPIGVAGVYYATFVVRETGLEIVWTVVSLVMVASTLAHGVSAVLVVRGLERARDRE